MYAFITTDETGKLTADSTCTINGKTVPVPARHPHGGHLAPLRIVAAMKELGYTPDDYYGSLKKLDSGVWFAVKPISDQDGEVSSS